MFTLMRKIGGATWGAEPAAEHRTAMPVAL